MPGTPEEESGEALPSDDELQEPSTEKEPSEEPSAPERSEPEPSHEAVGIGVVGRPQVEPEATEH
ncbi:hypothetical protein [Microbacterium sp. CIAB417]|uniref:hypothetical protein n=1 Tax=Microbacterium sp. CIAB417 TaxID=2860287 RepID=UPI001FACAC51|nr:hypothetical protein [Microbacterium sp. CIAB417]